MSELSAAAAAALGVPEAIVQRSAAARAEETGMTVDEVLAVWAGGGDIPAAAAPPTPSETVAAEEEAEPEAGEAVPPSPPAEVLPPAEAETAPPSQPPAGEPAPTVSGKPPVLVGASDSPITVLVGVVALFVAFFLVGLVGPALPTENPGARSSNLPFSDSGIRGQNVYRSVGCSSCHTQLVRPVVADVGLGAVTLNDSNQVLGARRFGPDLSNAGGRLTGSQIEAIVSGLGDHPALALSAEDLADLVTYLLESRTMEPTAETDAGGEEPAEEEPAEQEPAEEEPAES